MNGISSALFILTQGFHNNTLGLFIYPFSCLLSIFTHLSPFKWVFRILFSGNALSQSHAFDVLLIFLNYAKFNFYVEIISIFFHFVSQLFHFLSKFAQTDIKRTQLKVHTAGRQSAFSFISVHVRFFVSLPRTPINHSNLFTLHYHYIKLFICPLRIAYFVNQSGSIVHSPT